MMDRKKVWRIALIGGGIILVIIIISLASVVRDGLYSSTLYVEFTPLSASARLEGDYNQSLDKHGEYKIRPGNYTVIIEKDGFDTYSQEFTVEAKKWKTVYVILEPNREDTMDWYETHPEDAEMRERLLDRVFDPNTEELQSTIRDEVPQGISFPIYGPGVTYEINYGDSETRPGGFALFATYYNDEGKELLDQRLRNLSGDGTIDYEIIYIDETAPEITHDHGN